jgi:hypothetical protein
MVHPQRAAPVPGIPGAPGRQLGWRRRGYRRPPRRGRTSRSRRSATRRPHRAGQALFRHAAQPPRGQRTEASCSAGRGRRTPAGTAEASLPRPAGRRGWPGTSPERRRQPGGGPSPGKVLLRGCSGSSSPDNSDTSVSRAIPSSKIRRAAAASWGVGPFLAGIPLDRRAEPSAPPAPARSGRSAVRGTAITSSPTSTAARSSTRWTAGSSTAPSPTCCPRSATTASSGTSVPDRPGINRDEPGAVCGATCRRPRAGRSAAVDAGGRAAAVCPIRLGIGPDAGLLHSILCRAIPR